MTVDEPSIGCAHCRWHVHIAGTHVDVDRKAMLVWMGCRTGQDSRCALQLWTISIVHCSYGWNVAVAMDECGQGWDVDMHGNVDMYGCGHGWNYVFIKQF